MTLENLTINEPDWFVQRRLAALDSFEKLSLPTIQRFDFHNWQLTPPTETIIKTNVAPQDDCILVDLFAALNEYPDLVQKYLYTVIKADENKLAAYHVAFVNQGAFLYVPENTVVEKPIELEFQQDSSQPFVSHVRQVDHSE